MADLTNISKEMWTHIPKEKKDLERISRPSMTYWQDAWRRLKKNYLSMFGLVMIIIMVLLAAFGPMVIKNDYSSQNLAVSNIPLKLAVVPISDEKYVYVNGDYKLLLISKDGVIEGRAREKENNMQQNYRLYSVDGKAIMIDYKYAKMDKSENPTGIKYKLLVDGQEAQPSTKVSNKSYILGTDALGRDMVARLLFGARISLFIAFISTIVNFFIGVVYGGFSGYIGGKVDNAMMRFVDIVNTIPLLLYVILLSVVIGSGLKSIIIAIGSVYWLSMARLVRGQVLSLKEQEYILAARTLGASTWRIMVRHLIPNAMGPIIVALTMMIPSAIFTEAFLSFIGLGVNAPMASWGTLANDALGGLRTYPYQLFEPSLAICITMLAFNFLGDGLRDALDPRLRK